MTTFLSDLDGLRECLTRRPDVLNFHGFRGEVPVAHYIVVRDGKLFPTIDRPTQDHPRSSTGPFDLTPVPDEWNDDFQRGIIPFLPRCPLCGTQNVMTGNSEAGDLKNVSCVNTTPWNNALHYVWKASENLHYLEGKVYTPA